MRSPSFLFRSLAVAALVASALSTAAPAHAESRLTLVEVLSPYDSIVTARPRKPVELFW